MSNLGTFVDLCAVCAQVGTVTSAMLYDSGFVAIDGITKEGKKFSITMSIKEEDKDA